MKRLPFAKPRRKPAKKRKPLKRSPVTRGKTVKRFAARRNDVYREWIRTLPCTLLGRKRSMFVSFPQGDCIEYVGEHHRCAPGDVIDPAHVKSRGAGADDVGQIVPLCHTEHSRQHQHGIKSWAREWFGFDGLENLKAEAEKLAAEYGRITADGEHQP
jgi:hypothetical protein